MTYLADPKTLLYGVHHRLNMELDLKSLFGLLCTAVLIGSDLATPPSPAFGLIYEGFGQPRWTTSLCNTLGYTNKQKEKNKGIECKDRS